jgi:hypothetical protein
VRELRTEKKDFEEQARKAGKFGEDLKKYEKEREIIKEKIETVINQIDQLGILLTR